MYLRSNEYVYPGNADHPSMEWGIEWDEETGKCYVVEAHGVYGAWIRNCELPTMEACNNFIWAWINDNL
jgi:hypothetical protein